MSSVVQHLHMSQRMIDIMVHVCMHACVWLRLCGCVHVCMLAWLYSCDCMIVGSVV